MRSMRREEIEGVLAHEVSHIQNGDMVTMTLIQGVVNAFSIFFSRVIANIVRQLVDERISGIVFFVDDDRLRHRLQHPRHVRGRLVLARARVPRRRRRRGAVEPRQHDRRAAAPARPTRRWSTTRSRSWRR